MNNFAKILAESFTDADWQDLKDLIKQMIVDNFQEVLYREGLFEIDKHTDYIRDVLHDEIHVQVVFHTKQAKKEGLIEKVIMQALTE